MNCDHSHHTYEIGLYIKLSVQSYHKVKVSLRPGGGCHRTAPRQSPSLVCGSNELQSRRSPIQIEKGLLTVEKPVDSGNYRQEPLEFRVPISFGNLLIGTTNTSVKFL